jgi:ligand-binding sensor domain-containing protein
MMLKNLNTFLLSVLFILIGKINSHAQEFGYRQLTIEDGLPTNEVYHVMQDSKGYIWVSTDYGVCRYNGEHFETFTVADGLPNNIVFESYEDSQDRIWFRTLSLKIVYFENDSIYKSPWNKEIDKGIHKLKNTHITQIAERERSICFGIGNSFILTDKNKISVQYLYAKHVKFDSLKSNLPINNNLRPNKSYVTNEYRSHHNSSLLNEMLLEYEKLTELFFFSSDRYSSAPNQGAKIKINDSIALIASNKTILLKNLNNQVITEKNTQSRILSVSYGKDSLLYVGTETGLEVLNANDLSSCYSPFFTDKMISSAFIDREGALWISALYDGLYYIGNPNLLLDNVPNNISVYKDKYVRTLTTSLNANKNTERLLIGFFNNNPVLHVKSAGNKMFNYKLNGITQVHDAIFNKDTLIITFGSAWAYQVNIHDIDNFKFNKLSRSYRKVGLYNERVYYGSRGDLIYWNHGKEIIVKDSSDVGKLLGTYHGLYIGVPGKLFRYVDDTIISLLEEKIKNQVTDIVLASNKLIWVCTKGSGLFCIDSLGTLKKHFTTQNGLVSNYCTSICFDSNNDAWIGTNKGLQRLNTQIEDNVVESNSLILLTKASGLISDNVTDVAWFNNKVYVGTIKGITVLDPQKIKLESIEFPVIIESIRVNDSLVFPKANAPLILSHKENSIYAKFLTLSYKLSEPIHAYRLIGHDSNWVETSNSEIRYANLSAGNYQLEVITKNVTGEWNKNATLFNFSIAKAYWQTWWFIGITLVIIGGLVLWFFRLRLEVVNKQNKLSEDLLIARQQALNAQMNPHFVFNVLNSINSYVLENRALDASKYLAKFASLVRKTLENSFKETIALSDELKLLESYIILEKIRYNGEFEYVVDSYPNVKPDQIMIPPLLLQPFLENCIWHGFSNKQVNGKINIRITQTENQILISIVDNGIGRVASSLKSNNQIHSSKGMMITNKRLKLAKKRYKNDFILKTYDLYHNDKNSAGTKVNLWLSLNSKK